MSKILILGGYGNFGKRIARALLKANIPIIINGRKEQKAIEFAKSLENDFDKNLYEIAIFDAETDLDAFLKSNETKILINTCGPFQAKDYRIAQIAIENGAHYIDLADGRDFVVNITSLDEEARTNKVSIISGASTVPGLSSAALEEFKGEFQSIESLKFGISPGQKAERGLATTMGILSYAGKPLKPFAGHDKAFGWQDIYWQKFKGLGFRPMANCDIPDLDLLPPKYGIKNIQFSAGLELNFLHLGLWALSYLVRWGVPLNLENYASLMLKAADWFNFLGSDDGGMFMDICGIGKNGETLNKKWFIIAKNGDGPQIPTIPAIILAKKLYNKQFKQKGAMPCVGLVSLSEYLDELKDFEIETYIN